MPLSHIARLLKAIHAEHVHQTEHARSGDDVHAAIQARGQSVEVTRAYVEYIRESLRLGVAAGARPGE